jgi:NAD(P)-dependent dehydrogenase (short-subunit alcohol dehydrogenase family)
MREELETSLFGPLALASAFAGRIAERSDAIVNVFSVLAWLPVGASYGATKAALWSATDSMRSELAPRGVQVVGVYVGLVDTDLASSAGDSPKSSPVDVVRQVRARLRQTDWTTVMTSGASSLDSPHQGTPGETWT